MFDDLLGQEVFSRDQAEHPWEDVVLWAVHSGDWDRMVERARAGLALVAADEEDPQVSEDELEEAANEFRYDRDLVTADEMEEWLGRWGLDVEAWLTWVKADLLRSRSAFPAEAEMPDLGPDELEEAVRAEAVCSKALARWAYRLATKIAVREKLREDGEELSAETNDVSLASSAALSRAETLLAGRSKDELLAKFCWIQELELAARVFRQKVLLPGAVEASIRGHQTDWMRVTVQTLRLPSEDMAREALISIREDGQTIGDVASDAGVEFQESTYFLEELDGPVRDRLLPAQRGELLGPLRTGDDYSIYLVLDKALPTAQDPQIAARAEEKLMKSAVTREVDNRISWRFNL